MGSVRLCIIIIFFWGGGGLCSNEYADMFIPWETEGVMCVLGVPESGSSQYSGAGTAHQASQP